MNWVWISLISALFSALAAISQKRVLANISALHFTTVLAFFNFIVVLPIPFVFALKSIGIVTLLVIIGKSLLSGFAFLMVMQGIKRAEISQALPLLVLTPGIVALIAFLTLGETLSSYDLLGLLFLGGGTALLQYRAKQLVRATQNKRGLYYIGGALCIFSVTAVLDKAILKNYKVAPIDFWFYQHLVLFFFFSIVSICKDAGYKPLLIAGKRAWKLIILISVFTLIYRYSFIVAVKLSPSVALALSFKRISVLFVTIFGGYYFKEGHLFRKTVATIVLLIGAWLVLF